MMMCRSCLPALPRLLWWESAYGDLSVLSASVRPRVRAATTNTRFSE